MCLLPLIENVLCLQLKMSGFVCLTIFLIGSEFRGAQTSHLEISNNRKLQGVSSTGREFRINNDFSEYGANARDAGKAYRGRRHLIPMILAFALAGISSAVLMLIKSVLLKAAFIVKLTLILTGFIIALKISGGGMSPMLYLYNLNPTKNNQYPEHEPDLSGYGYEHNRAPGFEKPDYKYSPY